jgi:hypothetical protein
VPQEITIGARPEKAAKDFSVLQKQHGLFRLFLTFADEDYAKTIIKNNQNLPVVVERHLP